MSEHTLSTKRYAYFFFAILLALAAEVLAWGYGGGFGFFVFLTVGVSGFFAVSWYAGTIRSPRYAILTIPAFLFAIQSVLYSNDFANSLAPFLAVTTAMAMMVLVTIDNPKKIPFEWRSIGIGMLIGQTIQSIGEFVPDAFAWRGNRSRKTTKVVIGILLSLPLLAIFFSLFVSADAVFAEMVDDLLRFEINTDVEFVRLGFITMLFGGFFYALMKPNHAMKPVEHTVKKQDKTIIGTVMTLVNGLFLVFIVLQVQYLFGAKDYVIDAGVTYAEYARSGFFEMVWVMVIAAALILFVYRSFSAHGHPLSMTIANIGLVAQVGVVGVSALSKMNTYQDAYGYTVLRLYVEWFMYMVLGLLLLTAIAMLMKRSFRDVLHIGVLGGLGALMLVGSVNVDRMIARENVDRYLVDKTITKKQLDVYYLTRLSIDAYPEVSRLPEDLLDSRVSSEYTSSEHTYKKRIMRKARFDDWREWSISRSRIQN